MRPLIPLLALAPLVGGGPAAAHAVGGVPPHPHSDWLWQWGADPWALVPLLLSWVLYAVGWRRLRRATSADVAGRVREAWCFSLGWLTAFVALCSPVDPMGDALFAAHMVQHELLMTVAAPLLVLGRPLPVMVWGLPAGWRGGAAGAVSAIGLAALVRRLCRPAVAFWVQAVVLWGWHAPMLFQASVVDDLVHTVQHASFFGAALAFWAGVLDRRRRGGSQGTGVFYLFGTAVHGSLLGALLTFSASAWYPVYAATAPAWGLTALEDQQLGGLIMWVPAGLSYVVGGLALVAGLLNDMDLRARRRESNPGAGR
ncbi:cytochrome c oxidase assembly protein [Azospirillum sp. ST 5-10]|uniref:cytochrome c oxidase assembly protein n=1 Tax=unclassified Azospirillum TaxID=2630922 RepID=UPI003F4A4BAB